jgi:23S rRNA (cytosine1962-C5)-methyltransferase
MLKLTVRPGSELPLRGGHPWVFKDEVVDLPEVLPDGEEADVFDARGNYIGRGLTSAGSRIVCRIYTRRREPLDRDFFRKRLLAAHEYRRGLNLPNKNTDGYRAVFADGDRLPGLTVDRYKDYLVLQTPTVGMDARKRMIVELLQELFQPAGVCERNDMAVRGTEGLPTVREWVAGKAPEGGIIIRENGILYDVDPLGAMKTGHFFDQRDNRLLLERVCRGKKVLEVFSYTGGFGLAAAKFGAESVVSVDQADLAIEAAKRNARLNGFENRIDHIVGDGFEVLRNLESEGKRFDGIVLDPPAFAKSKTHKEAAARGYKEINLRALKMLPVGGFLLTCSCSYQTGRGDFRKIVMKAAGEARRLVRVVAEGAAGADHPALLNVPETDYLKSLLLVVVEKL